jgi:hypothetical protein
LTGFLKTLMIIKRFLTKKYFLILTSNVSMKNLGLFVTLHYQAKNLRHRHQQKVGAPPTPAPQHCLQQFSASNENYFDVAVPQYRALHKQILHIFFFYQRFC